MSGGVVARACVAAIAVVVIAWLAVMERNEHLLKRGVETRSVDDFSRARVLNPDTSADVGRALVLQSRGEGREARRVLDSVLRREPENLRAWGLLYLISRDADPAAARRALAARRRLDPLGARPRPSP